MRINVAVPLGHLLMHRPLSQPPPPHPTPPPPRPHCTSWPSSANDDFTICLAGMTQHTSQLPLGQTVKITHGLNPCVMSRFCLWRTRNSIITFTSRSKCFCLCAAVFDRSSRTISGSKLCKQMSTQPVSHMGGSGGEKELTPRFYTPSATEQLIL